MSAAQAIPLSLLAECTYSKRALFLLAVLLTELYRHGRGARTLIITAAATPSIVEGCSTAWLCGFGSCLTGGQ